MASDRIASRWSEIGRMAWKLAREALEESKKTECDPIDYIWDKANCRSDMTEFESAKLGEWACENLERIKEGRD